MHLSLPTIRPYHRLFASNKRCRLTSSPAKLKTCVSESLRRETKMKIEHVASWVSDLERTCSFYERWFQATKGPRYSSTKHPFHSYFLSLDSGSRLGLMVSPGEA